LLATSEAECKLRSRERLDAIVSKQRPSRAPGRPPQSISVSIMHRGPTPAISLLLHLSVACDPFTDCHLPHFVRRTDCHGFSKPSSHTQYSIYMYMATAAAASRLCSLLCNLLGVSCSHTMTPCGDETAHYSRTIFTSAECSTKQETGYSLCRMRISVVLS